MEDIWIQQQSPSQTFYFHIDAIAICKIKLYAYFLFAISYVALLHINLEEQHVLQTNPCGNKRLHTMLTKQHASTFKHVRLALLFKQEIILHSLYVGDLAIPGHGIYHGNHQFLLGWLFSIFFGLLYLLFLCLGNSIRSPRHFIHWCSKILLGGQWQLLPKAPQSKQNLLTDWAGLVLTWCGAK